MRRRGLPGWLPRSSHSVERAFTPAAHWQFQNRALPRREHPREGHGPPLRTGTDATTIRLARNIKFIRRGGIDPARGCSRRRRVRRDEGIPPYGCPDGRGRPVWLCVCHGLQGRGMPLPQPPVPPQTGPILNRPLQGGSMAAVTAVSRLLRASPPFVGADSISSRGCSRRRRVPGTMQASSPT